MPAQSHKTVHFARRNSDCLSIQIISLQSGYPKTKEIGALRAPGGSGWRILKCHFSFLIYHLSFLISQLIILNMKSRQMKYCNLKSEK